MPNRDYLPTTAQAAAAFQEAQQLIAQAARDRATDLNLNHLYLTSVPPEIGQLTQLTTLYLNHNELRSLPPEIGQLAQLTTLFLHYNQLTSVPPEIGQLTQLTRVLDALSLL